MTKQLNPRAESKLEMKQVFRKDPPVVFDIPARITNSSSRQSYTGNRMHSARGEAAERAAGIRSHGIGC